MVMHNRRLICTVFAFLFALVLVGSSGAASVNAKERAAALLRNAEGKRVGMAQFTQESKGVRIVLTVKDLSPGERGIHIHAVGKCEPPDFASAGPHFNPTDKKHGLNNPEGPHAGDLPNLTVREDGTAVYEQITDRVTLTSGELSLFDKDGSALVIHAHADDQQTDPTGNSGARIVCGVIMPVRTISMGMPPGAGTLLLLGAVGLLLWLLFLRR
jgi:Cu-Zn family superoxide dismutase